MAKDGKRPWLRLAPQDLFSDHAVMGMAREQRWRYTESLFHSWLSSTPGVAAEDQWRRWMSYTLPEWVRFKPEIVEAFVVEGDVWTQKRLVAEWAYATRKSRQAADAGTRSAAVRMTPTTGSGRSTVGNGRSTDVDARYESIEREVEESNQNTCPSRMDETVKPVKKAESLVDSEWREGFPQFWEDYPRRQKRPQAEKAWMKLELRGQSGFDEVVAGLERWKASKQWQHPEYIPLPATWLNASQWQDEVEEVHGVR